MPMETPLHPIVPRSAIRSRPLPTTEVMPFIHERASRTKRHLRTTGGLPSQVPKRQTSSQLVPVGLTMLRMVLLFLLLHSLIGWMTVTVDDLHYSRPRTTHVDAFVGHESGRTPSHFVAMNLDGQVHVIEFPGGKMSHACLYVGPQLLGPERELAPVRLSFVPGAVPGPPTMVIHIEASEVRYRNERGSFVPQTVP